MDFSFEDVSLARRLTFTTCVFHIESLFFLFFFFILVSSISPRLLDRLTSFTTDLNHDTVAHTQSLYEPMTRLFISLTETYPAVSWIRREKK